MHAPEHSLILPAGVNTRIDTLGSFICTLIHTLTAPAPTRFAVRWLTHASFLRSIGSRTHAAYSACVHAHIHACTPRIHSLMPAFIPAPRRESAHSILHARTQSALRSPTHARSSFAHWRSGSFTHASVHAVNHWRLLSRGLLSGLGQEDPSTAPGLRLFWEPAAAAPPNMSVTTQAFVTLATNDIYCQGALVLGLSLRNHKTTRKLVVLITPQVSSLLRDVLSRVFDEVIEVNLMDSEDYIHLAFLKRPELGVTLTKLHCWTLTHYSKCVFLDADTLVLHNIDELFDREELSAAPDPGWPDCFNSGVFVFQPSLETHQLLLQHATEHGSFDGADQGLLNSFFSDWPTADIHKHLPFIYNLTSNAAYTYSPAFQQFGSSAKVVHFLGSTKPWNCTYDPQTGSVSEQGAGSGPPQHVTFLNLWWRLFQEGARPLYPTACAQERQGPAGLRVCSDGLEVMRANSAPSAAEPCANSAAPSEVPCANSAPGSGHLRSALENTSTTVAETRTSLEGWEDAPGGCTPASGGIPRERTEKDPRWTPVSPSLSAPETGGCPDTLIPARIPCAPRPLLALPFPDVAETQPTRQAANQVKGGPAEESLDPSQEVPGEPCRDPGAQEALEVDVAASVSKVSIQEKLQEPSSEEERKKWEEGRMDYMGKDAFARIQEKLDRFLH
ncbi:glycogenin-2 isoform X4 [Marmota marmota marmota]|uniref:glycogenin-2 isoform X4 n=1 Tax=Marmota marmota marmota TaxID=9994 RepID=UPI0020939AB1|nr:glycogenin-2 isoform X4 [Marmota marmota marmota]